MHALCRWPRSFVAVVFCARAVSATTPTSPLVVSGYAEAVYAWNFNAPSNGITHFRGFDNRHNTFTLSNVAVDAAWDDGDVVGRVALQVGHTPSTYFLSEPSAPGASATNASGAELWKYVQQAYAGYRFDVAGRALVVSAGLFLSPIGPESIAVKDNWNWSRSNLFFGLPCYHAGVRATLALSDVWTVTLAGYNGWNSVVDNNAEKSVSAQVGFSHGDVAAAVLYFGGVERPPGAVEGRAWRHLIDVHATWQAAQWLSVLGHANEGFEATAFGVSAWAAMAVSARVRIADAVFVAVRGDVFHERVGQNGDGRAASIFWPASVVASATATLDYRPHPQVSFRAEARCDGADADMYFGGTVEGDGVTASFVPNRQSQATVSAGATTWF
jgi:hypothetical protein